jgi:hypothetical protein
MAQIYNPRYSGSMDRRIVVQDHPQQIVQDSIEKCLKQKAGSVAWVVVSLTSKHMALNLNPSASKKDWERERERSKERQRQRQRD